jgi:enamine deaminase RidA (YjgF/YER057c/UK114 family)
MGHKKHSLIERTHTETFDIVKVNRECFQEYYINVHHGAGKDSGSLFKSLAEYINKEQCRIVMQYVFGNCSFYEQGRGLLKRYFKIVNWPVTWIEAGGAKGSLLTGMQVFAVKGTNVESLSYDNEVIASVFEDDLASYCFTGDLRANDISQPREAQAEEAFKKVKSVLSLVGMDFKNVIRTWLYVDDILSWYDGLNTVRTNFFNENGVFDGLVPASTGIGVANHDGAAMVLNAYAIKPKSGEVVIEEVVSPMQCPATDYKSSFSRALEIRDGDVKKLLISGTASIEPGGKTVHINDIDKQIVLTMEVVEAILKSRDYKQQDICRAIAYFSDMSYKKNFTDFLSCSAIKNMPVAYVHGDICRDDLLFEIELDVITDI